MQPLGDPCRPRGRGMGRELLAPCTLHVCKPTGSISSARPRFGSGGPSAPRPIILSQPPETRPSGRGPPFSARPGAKCLRPGAPPGMATALPHGSTGGSHAVLTRPGRGPGRVSGVWTLCCTGLCTPASSGAPRRAPCTAQSQPWQRLSPAAPSPVQDPRSWVLIPQMAACAVCWQAHPSSLWGSPLSSLNPGKLQP